jgi:hypothetical protein
MRLLAKASHGVLYVCLKFESLCIARGFDLGTQVGELFRVTLVNELLTFERTNSFASCSRSFLGVYAALF